MKANVCKVCGFVSIDGKAPEKCPVCGSGRNAFEEKEDAVKLPADTLKMTDFEKKHTPVLKAEPKCALLEGCRDINVKTGEIKHPMLPEHFITYLDFYLNREFIGRFHLTPVRLNAAVTIHLSDASSGRITAISKCNQHGAWMGEVDL